MSPKRGSRGSRRVQLGDGIEVLIRPIAADDKGRLEEAVEGFSPDTRYRRFFAPIKRLTPQELRYFTEIDHDDHEAVVAIDPEEGSIVGVARYIRTDPPTEAEVAVAVTDEWQGRGVATALLDDLSQRARGNGIHHFLAVVMADNQDALELFRNLAPGESRTSPSDSGKIEMLIDLPDPGRVRHSRLGRLLRLTAGARR